MLNEETPPLEQKPDALAERDEQPRLEQIKNVAANKIVTAARDLNGKFQRKATLLASETAKRVTKVMYTPDENGETQLDRILKTQATVAEENSDPRNLGQVSSFLETVDEVSGQKMIRSKLAKDTDNANAIREIKITININKPVVSWDEKQREQAQREKHGPSFAHVESITTNPAPPQEWYGRDRRRPDAPPLPESKHDRRKGK
jgi:hypothetical protein